MLPADASFVQFKNGNVMPNSFALKLIAGCAGFIWASAAFSHISLETKTALQNPASGTSTKGLDYPAAVLEVAVQAPGLLPAAMSVAAEPLQVQGAWVRTSVAGQGGTGAFMKLTARNPMRLVGVSSPVAGVAEVHEMKMEGDVMKMRAVPGLDLPAGQAVELKPGGYHLMLMQLRQPLTVGTTVPLTLILKDASGVERRQNLQLPVSAAAPGSAGKPDSGHGAHKH
jgi:periplasmic copper chaperone A